MSNLGQGFRAQFKIIYFFQEHKSSMKRIEALAQHFGPLPGE
jgi:hypothetical protein